MSGENFSRQLRVFLSYSSIDKKLAGEIKQNLESFNFEVFLAHEDIEPAIEWQEEIIRNLRTCDIFIPIVSKNFKESKWTDQESGFVLALNKLIIPIEVNLVPYGFIGKYQALKLGREIHDSCIKVIKIVRAHPPFKELLDNRSIKAFLDSVTFDEANTRAEGLELLEPFTPTQINEIIRGYLANDQIQGAWRARPRVVSWFEKYKDDIQPALVEQFEIFSIRDSDKRGQAIEELVYRLLEEKGATTDLEFMEYFDLSFILISRALSRLVREGKVVFERKVIDGRLSPVYSLTENKDLL